MKRIGLLLLLVVLAAGSVWGEIVEIPDSNLRAALVKALGKNEGDPITDADLKTLKSFEANDLDITDLTGIEHCLNLESLVLHSNQIVDISPLNNLIKLTQLNLDHNKIKTVSALANLTELTSLHMSKNSIDDISPLANLINLVKLEFWNNQISDISALTNLTSLSRLEASWMTISDISALANLTELTYLHMGKNSIDDISPLANLNKLKDLDLFENKISEISPLKNLVRLKELSIGNNRIIDISPLQDLKSLINLNLGGNRIIDITPLLANKVGISNTVYLDGNPISDQSIVNNIPALVDLGVKVHFNIPEDLAKQIEKNKKDGVVNIPDQNLRAKLEEVLGKNEGESITKDEMATITTINWWESSENVAAIESIEGLQFCKALTFFNLNGSVLLTDLSPIRNLTTLKELYHNERSYIDDLSVLTQLTSLTSLSLTTGDQVTDLSPLGNLTNLEALRLRNNRLEDLVFLQNLTNLKTLDLDNNRIKDVVFLQNLTNLETLRLRNNRVEDISSLKNLTSLTGLFLSRNRIQDLTPLQKLTNLSALYLEDNRVTDVSPLSELLYLKDLRLVSNRIMDISPLLEGGGISNSMDLRYNPLNEISLTNHLPALILAGVRVSYNESVDIDKLLADYKPGKFANQTKGSFKLQLPKGLNMISLPLEPETPMSAKSLSTELSATVLIKLDKQTKDFVSYVPEVFDSFNFTLEGAEGYIVNVMKDQDITFNGTAWDNTAAAPSNLDQLSSTTWAFTVVIDNPQLTNQVGVIRNLRTGQTISTSTLSSTDLSSLQRQAVSLVDQSRQPVVEAGDLIEVNVGSSRWRYQLNQSELERAYVYLDLAQMTSLPNQTQLLQNYPNPFNPETWIPFDLAEDTEVTVTIYDVEGQTIRTLDLGWVMAGRHHNRSQSIYWDGRTEMGETVASGVYFYQISAADHSQTRRMVILK